MKKEYNTNPQLIEKYKEKREVLKKLLKICDDIIDGTNESEACRKNEIDKSSFRHFFTKNWVIDGKTIYEDKSLPMEFPTWQDELFAAIFGMTDKYAYITDDFDKALAYCLLTLTEKERSFILLKYKEGLTLEEIGKMYGVTTERVRQIIAKTLRRLRHPKNSKYLLYGYDLSNKYCEVFQGLTEERRKYEIQINETKKSLKQIKNNINKLEENKEEMQRIFKDFAEKIELENTNEKIEDIAIEELDFSIRAYNCIKRGGISTLSQLMDAAYKKELWHVRNLGKRSLKEIIDKLISYGADKSLLELYRLEQ